MKSIRILLSFALVTLISSCSLLDPKSPRDYFDTAALNCNMLSGFAGKDFDNYLTYTPVMYNQKTAKTDSISFKENIQNNLLHFIEANFEQVKALKVTDETKAMIEASIDLYNYALPKYKNDFLAIAQMKDDKRTKEEVEKAINEFVNNYSADFKIKYNAFLTVALAFAKKNNIDVTTF